MYSYIIILTRGMSVEFSSRPFSLKIVGKKPYFTTSGMVPAGNISIVSNVFLAFSPILIHYYCLRSDIQRML